jgi:hypothetical protein
MEIGEIKYGREIGKKALWNKFRWEQCPNCKKERWVAWKGGSIKLCGLCNAKEHGLKINR